MAHSTAQSVSAPNGEARLFENPVAQLWSRMQSVGENPEETPWALMAKVLNYASEATRQLDEQRRRIAELEALSTTDALTGLSNRRGLDEFLKQTLSAAARHNEEGVLIFIDLDDFKAINDTYGHEAGDVALKSVADLLKAQVRASDLVARVGGDEFVAILTRCLPEYAADRASAIEAAVAKSRIRYGRRIIPVSASCGYTIFTGHDSPRALMDRADRMMYRTKAKKSQHRRR